MRSSFDKLNSFKLIFSSKVAGIISSTLFIKFTNLNIYNFDQYLILSLFFKINSNYHYLLLLFIIFGSMSIIDSFVFPVHLQLFPTQLQLFPVHLQMFSRSFTSVFCSFTAVFRSFTAVFPIIYSSFLFI